MKPGGERGFALPIALLLVATASVTAASVLSSSLASRGYVDAVVEATQRQLLLRGAVDIGLDAFRGGNEPLKSDLLSEGSTVLHLAGEDVTLRLERESGKVDLNTAPPELVLTVLSELGKLGLQVDFEGWKKARAEERAILAELDIMVPSSRFRPEAARAVEALTVLTALPGVAPEAAPPIVLAALRSASEGKSTETEFTVAESPVYSLLANTRGYGLQAETSFKIETATGRVVKVRQRWRLSSP